MSKSSPLFSAALRRCMRGYTRTDFKADLLAGLVVGIIAVPLSMALAISTGVPPEHGLYTAIIAGAVAAALGGADLQVSGPTAAFVVILAPVVHRFGLGGLCLATSMAGVMLLAAAALKIGRWVRLVPHAVTLGFTGGIGITIAALQLKDFFGLTVDTLGGHFFAKLGTLVWAMPSASLADALVGVTTLTLLLTWPKISTRVPAALAALAAGTGLSALLRVTDIGHAARIADRFGYVVNGVRHAGIPRAMPTPSLHWFAVGTADLPVTQLAWAVLPSAIIIAALAALESLLAAVVGDGMSNRRHDSDSELFGIGAANVLAPFFGGFAATGAIARTAANIRSGARSPVAALIHAGFVLAAILVLAPILSQLPMAAMSALLLTVAWNMADAKGIVALLRRAPREEGAVLLLTLGLTVAFDMVVGTIAGVALSTAFMVRAMASASAGGVKAGRARTPAASRAHNDVAAPADLQRRGTDERVVVHSVQGPLFFADTEQAFAPLRDLPHETTHLVLDLTDVPMLDASGVACVEEALQALERQHIDVVLVAPEQAGAKEALAQAGLLDTHERFATARSRAEALHVAQSAVSPRA